MKCPNCNAQVPESAFIELPDGSKQARCHGCLAFVVIQPGETKPATEPAEPEPTDEGGEPVEGSEEPGEGTGEPVEPEAEPEAEPET